MICERIERVLERIHKACQRAGRREEEVTLLVASKYADAHQIKEAFGCGVSIFGESRVQDFLKKYEQLASLPIRWHFIGRLQSNKVKYIIEKVELIHSLDRNSLAEEIDARAKKAGKRQDVLIEVNVGEEETKGGVAPQELDRFFQYVLSLEGIRVLGLMCIPPYKEDPDQVRPYFRSLREMKERLEREYGVALPHLSMGMSHDFEVAIEEGATIVRLGSIIWEGD
ncbi:alanine racemase domain protein [Thermocrinis albus DSM 14484]|uniref:Pyridoxal phosphate homeostasis protein n=1 Tax=Thermocrinis albus (strain DSM 14484 / JCM 11386 / HI 11/12) TaxID=638303 RepID=D3SNM0_THEAH|nr:YggS family pyridoxal phosphate-dependent enzyme [Thermocrinis albus]ADC88757.1 alanine racemase domain protein [Thermocrinis albus DSM 14484]